MSLHYTTVLSVSAAIAATQGLFLLFLWNLDRRSRALRWWAGAFTCLALGLGLQSAAGNVPEVPAVQVAGALILFAFGGMWQATRAFDGRRPQTLLLVLPLLLWFCSGLIDRRFWSTPADRELFIAVFVIGYLGMSVVEIWRGRGDRLTSRLPLMIALTAAALSYVMRIRWIDAVAEGGALALMPTEWPAWIALWAMVATSAAAALALALSKERMQQTEFAQIYLDPASGALNLGSFLSHAARLIAGQMRDRKPVSLLHVHLDDEDPIGREPRLLGDEELRAFYNQAASRLRPTDLVARVGAQTFAIVIPNAGASIARQIGDRMVATARDWNADNRTNPLAVSVGAVCSTHVGYDLRAMILAADAALEESKQLGLVCLHRSVVSESGSRNSPGRRWPDTSPVPLSLPPQDAPGR